jgi:glutathione S-transferase
MQFTEPMPIFLPRSAVQRGMPPRLYTFTLSHFSEKIRWALEESAVAFTEVPWTPVFHMAGAVRRGRRTTVPILEVGGRRVQDSTRILRWLVEAGRGPGLLPEDPALHDAVWDVEEQFDRVGEHVIRYAYSRQLDDPDSVVRYWSLDATARQRAILERAFPVIRFVFRRQLGMSAESVERSRAVIESGVHFIEERLSSGRRYLVGDRLSIADITAASLIAPLACPDEHPVYSTPRYRRGIAPVADPFRDSPAFRWVREIYGRHRAPSGRADTIRKLLE